MLHPAAMPKLRFRAASETSQLVNQEGCVEHGKNSCGAFFKPIHLMTKRLSGGVRPCATHHAAMACSTHPTILGPSAL